MQMVIRFLIFNSGCVSLNKHQNGYEIVINSGCNRLKTNDSAIRWKSNK
jgi:hypothetical protein